MNRCLKNTMYDCKNVDSLLGSGQATVTPVAQILDTCVNDGYTQPQVL